MFVELSRHVRIYITTIELNFLEKYYKQFPILQSRIDVQDTHTAKILSDKCVLVRKKLDNDTQYTLNKHIRFIRDDIKK